MRFLLLSAFILIGLMQNVSAQSLNLCPALSEEQTYKKDSSFKKLIEGKDGWIFRTKTDFLTNFQMNSALKERFVRLNKAFQDQNMQLVIALLPTRGMMHSHLIDDPDYHVEEAIQSYNNLVKGLRETGISVGAVEDFKAGQDFYYKRDHHWQAEGAKIIAQNVAREIKKLSSYNDIPKVSYKTESKETIDHEGTFQEYANKICGLSIESEKVPFYKTFEASGEENLFGDKTKADIVLIGTSNSSNQASHTNFDGFLKEYIGADIDNLSVSGGGVDTAMLDWFSSKEYQGNKPKIVIWEIPVYQNFKGEPFYRQAIPAAYGHCDDLHFFEAETIIENDRFKIEKEFLEKHIATQDTYLHLKFSDFKGRKFRLTTVYENGKKEAFDFRRSKFYQPDGIFFLEFDQDKTERISSLDGLMPKGTTGNVKASICIFPQDGGQLEHSH